MVAQTYTTYILQDNAVKYISPAFLLLIQKPFKATVDDWVYCITYLLITGQLSNFRAVSLCQYLSKTMKTNIH